jgi:NADPH-dependent curcumin reductase CurA
MQTNQWRLRRRPDRLLALTDVERVSSDEGHRTLRNGQIRLRNLVFLHAPTMRNWMSGRSDSLHAIIPLGAPVQAVAAGRVVESRDPRYPVGARVVASSCWSEFDIIEASSSILYPVRDSLTAIDALGMVGLNSLTAYFGVTRVGQPRPGETLVVSGAAGSTGSVAAQVGRLMGCRVVGIAGGAEKCSWLKDRGAIDTVIDYKDGNVADALKDACPSGIDVFFDNVGGRILQAAIDNMAKFGRIVLCGQISGYNESGTIPAFSNMMRVIYGSIRLQGFLFGDYRPDIPAALDDLVRWTTTGAIVTRQDVRKGFDDLPAHFNALFDGSNNGTLLGVIDDDAYAIS